MELDITGLLNACSYALDCVEAELTQVQTRHGKRVAYMSVCMAEKYGIKGDALKDLAACALLHDNALTQYIKEEFDNDLTDNSAETITQSQLGLHCVYGENNLKKYPFLTDVENVILYHHENADGSGPFGKTWEEVPFFARLIHLSDILDAFCRAPQFDEAAWERAKAYLEKCRGSKFDEEGVDLFFEVFSKENFLTLTDDDLEERLWKKVPHQKKDYSYEVCRNFADLFAKIIDYKSSFTSRHSLGVAQCAEKLSRYMKFDEDTCQKMYLAVALHDIGKIAVPDAILNKPARLTDEEYAIMKNHTIWGKEILCGLSFLPQADIGASYHHERYDGSGYPYGLKGDELPEFARIISAADALDAMNSNRCYRKHCDKDYIIHEFEKGSGSQFDEKIASIVIHLIKEGQIII